MFLFLSFFVYFFPTKSENRRAEHALQGRGEIGTSERGEVVGKGVGGWIWCI
jgi:hypothetical protein